MTQQDTTHNADIVIVGGGMVGSCLALALSKLPLKVSLVEAYEPSNASAPGFDARAIALSRASAKILHSLELWQDFKASVTPIKSIHVSDRGHPGICRLDAAEANIPAMGYVVELEQSGQILQRALEQSQIDYRCPAKVIEMTKQSDSWHLALDNQGQSQQIQTALVIAADGTNSVVRDKLGLPVTEKSYQQQAIISTLATQIPHRFRAFERFTEHGPVALLPLSDNRISLVWMLPPEQASLMMQSTDEAFLARLQDCFGYRLGQLKQVGKRFSYPLRLTETKQTTEGVIFVGNAAQSLHPIAGQGFNLGLRDVADLADVIADFSASSQSFDNTDAVNRIQSTYHQRRVGDKQWIVTMTDALARLFANPSPLLSVPRNLMLQGLSLSPQLRHEFGRLAMGLTHPAARLTRGLPLTSECKS